MTKFETGDYVKLKNGPVRYNDRVGQVIEVTRKNGRTSVAVDFAPRRKTPLITTASNLRLW